MKKEKFNNREVDVLQVLWNSSESLTAKEITELNPVLTKNTVQAVLTKLLSKKAIKVDKVVMHNKALSRSFVPIIDREAFILKQFSDVKIENMLSHFVKKEKNSTTLEKLESIIEKRRKELE